MSEKPVNPFDSTDTAADVVSTGDVAILGGRPGFGRHALFFLPAIIGLAADLITKSYMFAHHFSPQLANQGYPQNPVWWVEGIFGIQTSTNPGALFGIGKGYSWLFAIFSSLQCWEFSSGCSASVASGIAG